MDSLSDHLDRPDASWFGLIAASEKLAGAKSMDSINRASALTYRLRAFSRRQTLDPKAVDVNGLVAELEKLVRRTMGPAIEVESARADDLWLTLVDPNQIDNALLNLCLNARDAMPDGGRLPIETPSIPI